MQFTRLTDAIITYWSEFFFDFAFGKIAHRLVTLRDDECEQGLFGVLGYVLGSSRGRGRGRGIGQLLRF